MNDPEIFRILSTIAFPGATLLIAVYMPTGWWRSGFGRSFMSLAVSVWLFSLASSLRQWFGTEYPYRHDIRVAAQMMMVYAIYSSLIVLILAVRARKREKAGT